MPNAITTLKKTLRGYSTQARYYAAGNIELQDDEQFLVIGWARLGRSSSRSSATRTERRSC